MTISILQDYTMKIRTESIYDSIALFACLFV